MSDNLLTVGTLSPGWSTMWPQLTKLLLRNCSISGTLPQAWGDAWGSFNELDLAYNNIQGGWPYMPYQMS
eukprot:scaffold628658_cov34-Prasinocladus_malaysianus.AAC.1